MLRYITFLVAIAFHYVAITPGIAQTKEKDRSILIQLGYAFHLPAADMAERFGSNFGLSVGAQYLWPSNFTVGLGYQFLFGSQVKTDVLSSLRGPEGQIIGRDMRFASVFLRERGWSWQVSGGYLMAGRSEKARQGLLLLAGLGYIEHRIRIVDDFDSVTQLAGDLIKGYDRRSGGLSISQYIGYLYLDNNRLLNFHAGLEIIEGFTSSLRKFNYDTGMPDTDSRFDVLLGAKVGLIIPIGRSNKVIYY